MEKKWAYLVVTVLIAGFLAGQWLSWRQQRFDYVNDYMYEFSTRQMRSALTLGHDALLADMALIRGIQFYGKYYPLLDKHPLKYHQFKGLAESVYQLDSRHVPAETFWGFAFTSSQWGKPDSYRYLMRGARVLAATDEHFDYINDIPLYRKPLPPLWKLAKEAGYVAHYELDQATPEWACDAYTLALVSPDCPEFIGRLRVYACQEVDPDPLPYIDDLAKQAMATSNEALRKLNMDHLKKLIAGEHKKFWDFARDHYREIHDATPERISDLKQVDVLKAASSKYREMSAPWFDDGRTRLFPNLINPFLREDEPPIVVEAVEPDLPIDPYGGEYLIVNFQGRHALLSSGEIIENDRKDILAILNMELEEMKKETGLCPESMAAFEKDSEIPLPPSDKLGYALEFDPEKCLFFFPDISEDDPPLLPPRAEKPPPEIPAIWQGDE